ncbi:hypothetical protein [Klebsiella oxytoca]|uniref:hypothetical protein n=1 Tax=Klebsiella oxytoca TaxID=571 RepID=UPI001E439B35|nr:hypothetical protein [Klebsiella oxytoca]
MASFPGGDAAHLSGLPDRRRLRTRSPGKRSATREHSAEWHHFPEAMLRICPGYRIADVADP